MIRCYTQLPAGDRWLQSHRSLRPTVACVLGFTATGLIPGISAAGATPADRRYTALADAEFLWHGVAKAPAHPLPPLTAGVSPAVISRAVIAGLDLPLYLLNAGLPQAPSAPHVDLGGAPAACLTTGNAMPQELVMHLLQQGLRWGEQLATTIALPGYLVVGECVVGGTTTALAVLTGLGIAAAGKVNSSHAQCNHAQKQELVQRGLASAGWQTGRTDPIALVAAVGDPMQPVVAGMTIAASQRMGVLLAGGSQMLAVYALTGAIAQWFGYPWQPHRVAVGTTRWVAEDPTGDTVGLATALCHGASAPPSPILLATGLQFAQSRYSQLRRYEQGFVKEGVGAGGCAIAANLYQNWQQAELLGAIESLLAEMGLSPG